MGFTRASYIQMWTERLQIAGVQLKTQLLFPEEVGAAKEIQQPNPHPATNSAAPPQGCRPPSPRTRTSLASMLAYEREKRGIASNPGTPRQGDPVHDAQVEAYLHRDGSQGTPVPPG